MDFRILGSLQVLDEGREVALGGSKQRALLGVLLLHANQTLSSDRLIEELWGEQPPATAGKTVQVHVSRLRKALAAGAAGASGEVVVTREHGYELALDPERLDANRFERLVTTARGALAGDDPEQAAALLEEALSMWRGRPLDDLAYEPFAQREIARLEDLHIGALEELTEAKLALGRHGEVVSGLEGLIEDHPYRERLRGQLILALYRCDRQADALQAYQDARRSLVEELGIEPGERLRELERAVLAQDPALALRVPQPAEPQPAEPPPAPREEPAREVSRSARRLVSIVFADIVGSTGLAERLDPESMHGLLDRYMDACSAVIEDHGGTVEGFVGDAVVGVFGQNEIHEDDALRAVRTALEIREAGAALSADLERDRGVRFGMKLGIESGEVFVSAGARRSMFAAGDAFNVAARLEGAAPEGEILLGENVYRLLGGAARVERLEPLTLKGRTAKVQAWRLIGLETDGSAIVRPPATVLVNREREIEQLRAALARARDDETCQALTIVGPAGIGKSRLAQELVTQMGDEATVVVGRCMPYGEGATYRPLAEIVTQLGGNDPQAGIRELLPDDEPTARLVLGAVGLADAAAQAEETFWAIRKLLERVASEGPLIVVVEDIHWAEPMLLELLEYLRAFSSGHAVLFVCLARPELLEIRPAWAAPQPKSALVVLDALSAVDAHELVDNAGGGELEMGTVAKIVETADGNPLFLEQLVAVGAEDGDAALPSSIQAVLASRIDRLESGERAVLEYASVQGRSFYVGTVEELLPESERAGLSTRLVSLVHKHMVRVERSELPGEDAFRFTHVLIREAAYQGMPKQLRAGLHERIADWLQKRPEASDETIGHQLGQAYGLLSELGHGGERVHGLASAAAERLVAAADSSLQRGDPPEAARLLERAEALLASDVEARVSLLPRLGAALLEAGRLTDAERVLTEAIELAGEDSPIGARALVERQLVRIQVGSAGAADETARISDTALELLGRHGDDSGRCRALCLRALQSWIEGRSAEAEEAWALAAEHAHRIGDAAAVFEISGWRASAALFGPTPVPEAISRCRRLHEQVRSSPVAVARTFQPLAALHAMAGDFEAAHRLVRDAEAILGELGGLQSAVVQQEALVDMLAGRPGAAEARLRVGYERLEAMGEKALLASTGVMLGRALLLQGRLAEASDFCQASVDAADEEDLSAQIGWRALRARLLAADGKGEAAEEHATEAVRLGESTDFLTMRAEALLDLAEVLRSSGRSPAAKAAGREALELYEKKGDVVSAERVRSEVVGPPPM